MINIKSIWESQQLTTGKIITTTKINALPHLNCYAGINHITGRYLYIMSIPKNIAQSKIENDRFRGVFIFYMEGVENFELHVCLLDNDLKDVFALFIQNILDDVSEHMSEEEAFKKTLCVIDKWRLLFDKIRFNGLNTEQQKGLIGELLFLNYSLDREKTIEDILDAWTRPAFEDKDFVFGSVGIEVKFTASKNPRLQIISERQLDTQNLSSLFLVLYTAEEVKKEGFSLHILVERTRDRIKQNTIALKKINEKLQKIGYLNSDVNHYKKLYALRNTYNFSVGEDFPKIVKKQLPIGIYNTSYCIELSAVEKFSVDMNEKKW